MPKKPLRTLINPKGKYIGYVHVSEKNQKWYWYTISCNSAKKTATGHEPFYSASNARRALLAHKIDLKYLITMYA